LEKKNLVKLLKKIGRYIKYDGHPPPTPEELAEQARVAELKRLKQERMELEAERRKEEQESLKAEMERQEKIRLQEELEREQARLQWEKDAPKRALDEEEAMVDGELQYLDKLFVPCKKCGDDIMDINSKCSAEKCGAHKMRNAFDWALSPLNATMGSDIKYENGEAYFNGGGGIVDQL
jgi:hypothetical protein